MGTAQDITPHVPLHGPLCTVLPVGPAGYRLWSVKASPLAGFPFLPQFIDKPHTPVLWQDNNCTDHPECAAESCQYRKAKPPSIKKQVSTHGFLKGQPVPWTSACLCSRTKLSNPGWKTAMTALASGRVITGRQTEVCLPLTCNPGTCPWLRMEPVTLRCAGQSSNPWATPARATVVAL